MLPVDELSFDGSNMDLQRKNGPEMDPSLDPFVSVFAMQIHTKNGYGVVLVLVL